MFDSYDMSPVVFGTGKSARTSWCYFTENELSPGAARVGNYKAVFNLRGDDGQPTGGLAVDTNLGAGRARKNTSPSSHKCSTSGRTRRSGTTCS
jgi:arylsulfatase